MQVTLTIQERLKDLRTEKGLSLEELSKETGISKSALAKYESDDFNESFPFINLSGEDALSVLK